MTNKTIEEILTKAFNDFYDYIIERDIVKVAHEYSEKTVYKTATQALNQLMLQERIDELKKLKNAHSINIFDEYLEHRLAQLEKSKP